MKILFVAKHGCGDNDDEGSITHALRQLGHTVRCVDESPKRRSRYELDEAKDCDLCLFLKWGEVEEVRRVAQRMPCACWYFDLVKTDDPTLTSRARSRQQWFAQVLPSCLVGFCTDGEWAREYTARTGGTAQREMGYPKDDITDGPSLSPSRALAAPPKLIHLMQGADERVVGPGDSTQDKDIDILFTGMINHGAKRAAHIHELQARYGSRFVVHGDGGPNHRSHGRELADLIARAKIVLAPDGPQSDRYWSNRVYLTLGFQGFLLHPACNALCAQYTFGEKYPCLGFYTNRQNCNDLIDYYLSRPEERAAIAKEGYRRTLETHLYRHRVEQIITEVQKRL